MIGIICRDLKDHVDMISSFMKEVVSFVSRITQKLSKEPISEDWSRPRIDLINFWCCSR